MNINLLFNEDGKCLDDLLIDVLRGVIETGDINDGV